MIDPLERIDTRVIGDRLRIARSRAGITQDQAAKSADLSRTTLVAIEKGERRVRPEELTALANIYRLTLNELLRDHAISVDLEPRFRALPETERKNAGLAIALLNDLAAAEAELEALLGRRTTRAYIPERPLSPGDPEQQAEDASIEFRHRLGRGLSPLKDLVALLESEIGIRVFIRPIEERSISALFAFDEVLGACMLLNAYHTPERRLLSAAHECGHFYGTRHRPDVEREVLDAGSREERFARRFGIALLMPAPAIRSVFADAVREHGRFSPRHLVLMATRFGVSNEACCRRLEDLGLLPKGTWDSLKARGFKGELARKLLEDAGMAAVQGETELLTPRLWLLAAEAYQREILTEGQLVRMLRLPRVEVRKILDSLDDAESKDLLVSL